MIVGLYRSDEIFEALKNFLSENILATLSYALAFTQNLVRMVYHGAIIHEDLLHRIYNVSINHRDTVQNLLTNVDPNVYRTVVGSFSRLPFAEVNDSRN